MEVIAMIQQVAIAVTESSQVGEARRAAANIAARAGLDDTAGGRLAIIVTELATNLVRYARDGKIVLSGYTRAKGGCVKILAIDSGPGMDTANCMRDGYSTGGTPGNGLGAVERLASEFEMYSSTPEGTVIMAGVDQGGKRPPVAEDVRWGCISLPAPGEELCGDTCRFAHRDGHATLVVADGLGHGPDAAIASTCAATQFEQDPFIEPAAMLQQSHQLMSGTRGSAVAVASLDRRAAKLRYAGVGNIAGTLCSVNLRRGLPSLNGIVGAILPRLQTFEYALPESGIIVMHSDGLQSRWTLEKYPGLMERHPAVIAGVLYRDFYRGRDDVTVLIGAWDGGMP